MKDDALWKPVMALRGRFGVENAHAVFGHGIEGSLVLLQFPDVVVHGGQNVLWNFVDQWKRFKARLITNQGGLKTGVNGVAIVVMDQVFLKR